MPLRKIPKKKKKKKRAKPIDFELLNDTLILTEQIAAPKKKKKRKRKKKGESKVGAHIAGRGS
jgi:hypothetical protein